MKIFQWFLIAVFFLIAQPLTQASTINAHPGYYPAYSLATADWPGQWYDRLNTYDHVGNIVRPEHIATCHPFRCSVYATIHENNRIYRKYLENVYGDTWEETRCRAVNIANQYRFGIRRIQCDPFGPAK